MTDHSYRMKCYICLLVCSLLEAALAFTYKVEVSSDASYQVFVNGKQWLQSAPTYFYVDGSMQTLADGSLRINSTSAGAAFDKLGEFGYLRFQLTHRESSIQCDIKSYEDIDGFFVFEQTFTNGIQNSRPVNCSTDGKCRQETTGAFPSFLVQEMTDINLGYLNFGGNMIGNDRKRFGRWGSPHSQFTGGIEGGPITIFDADGNALIISPLNNFMSASFWHESGKTARVNWGVMGGVESLPAGHNQKFLIVGANSINKAFDKFGMVLEKLYGTKTKKSYLIQNDITLQTLSYFTDNGAYYYYYPEKNKTFQDTIRDVYQYSMDMNIPYRNIQLDSWWYYQGYQGGVTQWTARPDVFPDGIKSLVEYTKWPVSAHNRYWAIDNVYAKQNGGKYDFVMQKNKPRVAVPNDTTFWYDLIKNGTEWGLVMYEQDWLDWETDLSEDLQIDLTLGETWLKQMGQAADVHGVTIQYCMALPRHTLASIEIPVVTHARASIDYHLQEDQWKIGISSIFANALGIIPHKDSFWTTTVQDGNPRYPKKQELWPALQVAVATLSMGPVGVSDKIGATDRNLLMRCCNDEGLVLKPSKPALAIDKQLIQRALPETNGPEGEVWTTTSNIFSDTSITFGILLAANMSKPYEVTFEDTRFPFQLYNSQVFQYNKPEPGHLISLSQRLPLSECTSLDFCLYYFSPIFKIGENQISIYGEMDKYVPMSPQRISNIIITLEDMVIDVKGVPNENLSFSYLLNDYVQNITSVFTQSRFIRIYLISRKHYHYKA